MSKEKKNLQHFGYYVKQDLSFVTHVIKDFPKCKKLGYTIVDPSSYKISGYCLSDKSRMLIGTTYETAPFMCGDVLSFIKASKTPFIFNLDKGFTKAVQIYNTVFDLKDSYEKVELHAVRGLFPQGLNMKKEKGLEKTNSETKTENPLADELEETPEEKVAETETAPAKGTRPPEIVKTISMPEDPVLNNKLSFFITEKVFEEVITFDIPLNNLQDDVHFGLNFWSTDKRHTQLSCIKWLETLCERKETFAVVSAVLSGSKYIINIPNNKQIGVVPGFVLLAVNGVPTFNKSLEWIINYFAVTLKQGLRVLPKISLCFGLPTGYEKKTDIEVFYSGSYSGSVLKNGLVPLAPYPLKKEAQKKKVLAKHSSYLSKYLTSPVFPMEGIIRSYLADSHFSFKQARIGIGNLYQAEVKEFSGRPNIEVLQEIKEPLGKSLLSLESEEKLKFWNSAIKNIFVCAIFEVAEKNFFKVRKKMLGLLATYVYENFVNELEREKKMQFAEDKITVRTVTKFFYDEFRQSTMFPHWQLFKSSLQEEENVFHNDLCSKCLRPGDIIMCDTCNLSFDKECLGFSSVPAGFWYCPRCVVEFDRYRNSDMVKFAVRKYVDLIDAESK
eukprot:snap_masked-scaffold_31-processed-gene-2.27-mRNA-1 protein AED:1.00 eAED:1.00 QI:0/0/0/0/1/1/2/0/612